MQADFVLYLCQTRDSCFVLVAVAARIEWIGGDAWPIDTIAVYFEPSLNLVSLSGSLI